MLHLGCVTYNLISEWDLETIIRNLETAGFEAVELRTTHKHGVEPSLGPAERDRVRKRFEQSKVRLLSYGSTCEFHSADAAERKKNVEIGKQFADLAYDTGARGVKVRPNGFPKGVPHDVTIGRIGEGLRELGDYAATKKIEIWMEVHGPETQLPENAAAIMRAANHPNVGLCWNSNPTDVVNGSVRQNWELLRRWVKNAHINELADTNYPWRELFTLMQQSGYDRYTLCEVQASKQPERFLVWYKALWTELTRSCTA